MFSDILLIKYLLVGLRIISGVEMESTSTRQCLHQNQISICTEHFEILESCTMLAINYLGNKSLLDLPNLYIL